MSRLFCQLGVIAVLLALGQVPVYAGPAEPNAPQESAAPQPSGTEQPGPDSTQPGPQAASLEEVARLAQQSVVAVSVVGREGEGQALGTGFVVSADGLIATNRHVIGEARPVVVQFPDGRKFDVTAIHASDRNLDLAVLRIDAQDLAPLPLGNEGQAGQGEPVVALGNPYGLRNSVVRGVISGHRQVYGRDMLQLAIPVEPGNSGGPVLDRMGRVQGIVTIKSLVAENLGFAVAITALRSLLEKPNPTPMARWLTIGALDPKEWSTVFGSRWQQRAGRMVVSEPGTSFGGRSLCLSQAARPELPLELAVMVRLADESGAAGLVFHSDGHDKHYGFYPSGGRLRFTRFGGPDVRSWEILNQVQSDSYRPGAWNHLKVRIEAARILCYVNDQLVIESNDSVLATGQVGLAKFRDTQAEFKRFAVARRLPPLKPPAEQVGQVQQHIDRLPPAARRVAEHLAPLVDQRPASIQVLRDMAEEMQRRATELERLATDVHVSGLAAELARELDNDEGKINLCRAALLVAKLDDEELDVPAYVAEIDGMAAEITAAVPEGGGEQQRLDTLLKYLFTDGGFHGSRTQYYHRANSYLNRVIDDREGLPITLSVLTMELGRRIGLTIEGVNLPGHFLVRFLPEEGDPQLIDVFEGGTRLSREDVAAKVQATADRPLVDGDLAAADKRTIIRRMLGNLLGIAQQTGDTQGMLRYMETLVTISPDAFAERAMRAMLRFESGRRDAAIADLDWLLENSPPELDLEQIHRIREQFRQSEVE